MAHQSPASEMVACARSARALGENEKVHGFLVDAERLLTPDDLDGLTELWSAISQERMGEFEPDERDLKAGELLERLAGAGNMRAQEILMIDYLEGLNGRAKNFAKFLEWSERAMTGGSLLAASERKKRRVESRR